MLEFILRRTVLKKYSKEDQSTALLLKHRIKIDFIAQFLVYLFAILPLSSLLTLLILSEHTLSNVIQDIILIVAYIIFLLFFIKKFYEPISVFKNLVASTMYFSRYVMKGKALSKDDFDIVEKEQKKIYYGMKTLQVNGFCYSVCYELLKCLKKGTIQFVAIKLLEAEKDEENGTNNYYTMHVLYVNNNWCYDTYSQMQYPLEEVIKRTNAKVYKSFTYDDVKDKTYEDFRTEHGPALREWCKANDCYQKWLKD